MITKNLYSNLKPTGAPACLTCGGAGYYVMDVQPIHPQFGKAQKCHCFRMPPNIKPKQEGA